MNRRTLISITAVLLSASALTAQDVTKSKLPPIAKANTPPVNPAAQKRNDDYAAQLEAYLLDLLVKQYPERAGKAWHRDYSSQQAFLRSVELNRERWRKLVNPPELRKTGKLARRPHPELADLRAEWVTLPLGPLVAEGILAFPSAATPQSPVPLVIAQHGITGIPERVFGPPESAAHGYARELVKNGFAVLAPLHLRTAANRNRIERLARLGDTSLPGIEFARLRNLLDAVLTDPRIQPDEVGMWGISLGGMATMFFTPLEPRIKVCIVSGWFNHRTTKMAQSDDRYRSFLDTDEEHAFFRSWLTEFADHDVVSLICPRPLMIHHGKKDRIAHWPDVQKEFDQAKLHYEKLGIADQVELDIHEGGHEVLVEDGLRFMKRRLKRSR